MSNFPSDAIKDLWQKQPVTPTPRTADELRRKAQELERKLRRETLAVFGLLIFLAVGYASFLHFFPGTLQRVGAGMALFGFAFGAYDVHRRKWLHSETAQAASASWVDFYRAELLSQRNFCYPGVWLRLAAVVPGPVLFIMGFTIADFGLPRAIAIAIVMAAAPFAAGVPLNRKAALKFDREIAALDASAGRQ